jgi:hypothetical protein
MQETPDLDGLVERTTSAYDALVAALNAVEEARLNRASASYLPTHAVRRAKSALRRMERARDDPAMLLSPQGEARIATVLEMMQGLLDESHLEGSLSSLYAGYIEHAVNELADIPNELERLRENATILREEIPFPGDLIAVFGTATVQLLARLGPDPRDWLSLGPRRFEEILAEIWAGLGWDTFLTPPTKDGGFDIRAIRDTRGTCLCYLIEAKAHRPDRPVGIGVVRHLYGIVERERATHGIIATTSTFTRDAVREAEAIKYRLTLADFQRVLDWLAEYRRTRGLRGR